MYFNLIIIRVVVIYVLKIYAYARLDWSTGFRDVMGANLKNISTVSRKTRLNFLYWLYRDSQNLFFHSVAGNHKCVTTFSASLFFFSSPNSFEIGKLISFELYSFFFFFRKRVGDCSLSGAITVNFANRANSFYRHSFYIKYLQNM